MPATARKAQREGKVWEAREGSVNNVLSGVSGHTTARLSLCLPVCLSVCFHRPIHTQLVHSFAHPPLCLSLIFLNAFNEFHTRFLLNQYPSIKILLLLLLLFYHGNQGRRHHLYHYQSTEASLDPHSATIPAWPWFILESTQSKVSTQIIYTRTHTVIY